MHIALIYTLHFSPCVKEVLKEAHKKYQFKQLKAAMKTILITKNQNTVLLAFILGKGYIPALK